jgi:flagellar hook-associated protein 3 FlgL
MRISTSQYLSMNVQSMDNQQSELSQLYAEISSGQAITTPADNPLGAAQAVQLSMQGATLSQYSSNQSAALTQLGSEDSTLSSVIQALQSVNTQLESAGNASLSDSNRSAIAATLQNLNNTLMTLANAQSPSGGYLFGGFQSGSQPFTQNSAGTVVYNGDNGISSTVHERDAGDGQPGRLCGSGQYRYGHHRCGQHDECSGLGERRHVRDYVQRGGHARCHDLYRVGHE